MSSSTPKNPSNAGPHNETGQSVAGTNSNTPAESAAYGLQMDDALLAERNIGRILVEAGKISADDVERVLQVQRSEGGFFGEAAAKLGLINASDIQHALSTQFGYPYLLSEHTIFSKELVSAYKPFGPESEAFRAVRSHLLFNWLSSDNKILAVMSPEVGEGKSYVAANLAVVFAQLGKRTLLVDADLRQPRQHKIFNYETRVGLSAMLAGRVKREDLERLPESVPFFTQLSVLGAGPVPPNPTELIGSPRISLILKELRQYYDIIIIDTPAGNYTADMQAIAAVSGNALIVVRKDHTRTGALSKLMQRLRTLNTRVVGSVLNQF